MQNPEEDDDVDGDDELDDLPCNMTFSSVEQRDGYSHLSSGQYGSLQVSNGGGSSAVSSPAAESPEAPYVPTRFHAVNGGVHYSSNESKYQKPLVWYHECQKNHAASMGGHAVDGCGEFLPGGKEGTLEALKCAACLCHRNFHRREFLNSNGCTCGALIRSQAALMSMAYATNSSMRPPSPGVHESKVYYPPSSADISPHPHGVLPLGQFEDDDDDDEDEPPQLPQSCKKKRFRTKFTPEQKDRMLYFAETVGWRISKHDEAAIDAFCDEVGVKRNVFKVWMHNNKQNPRKRGRGYELDRNCDSPPDY